MIQQIESRKIEGFRDEYRFLSNFYPSPLFFNGISYPTAEHAYQAQKTYDEAIRQKIASLPYPGAAKKYGAKLPLSPAWDYQRLAVMEQVLITKFTDPILMKKLLGTSPAILEETNFWGDIFWGVCNGVGLNKLGSILMTIRVRMKLVLADPVMPNNQIIALNLKDITSMELKP